MKTADVVEVRDLVKHYDDVVALGGIDFDVHAGEVFALLGPNGAGKTTTVEILEGYRTPTSGFVRVLDFDPRRAELAFRARIGIVLQSSGIERELTVREALKLYGSYYPRRREASELIELAGLEEKANARVKTLSGGQRRRLELALALVGYPDLIFLDEPTTGFDPEARHRSWELIERLRSLGTTILLTSHYMEEVERLADRLAIVASGRILAAGRPTDLEGSQKVAVITFRLPPQCDSAGLPVVSSEATIHGSNITVRTADVTATLNRLTTWAIARHVELEELRVSQPKLEEIYLELTRQDPPAQAAS